MRHLVYLTILCATAWAAPINITTKSLPDGQAGAADNATVNAGGGKKPLTWSVSSGSLPPGLSLDGTSAAISGMPITPGSSSFTTPVRDSEGSSDTQPLSIAVAPAPVADTTASLPSGIVDAAYSATLGASGGAGGYMWSVSAGALNPGLTLSLSGTISGAPTEAGASNFTAQVRDSANRAATKPLAISDAASPLTITTSSLPGATMGTQYSASLSANGGSGGYSWSLSAGSLPAGLTLSSQGAIGGTPTAAGTANFTAQVKDSPGNTATKPLSLAVAAAPALTITTSSLPAGTVGTAYTAPLAASGGTAPYTWSVSAGSLPAGLTLSAQGAISGTPTAAGTANFTVQVKDSANTTTTKPFSIAVAAPPLTITTSSLPAATVGTAYSATLAASGGTGSYTWSVSAGSLPAGLTLSAQGAISGTPTAAGTANFSVQVKDSANTTTTKAFSIAVTAPPLTITTSSLPGATAGTAYSATLAATGGTGSYTWSVSAGALPAGLTLSAQGAISGTPTTAGTANFTVRVKDSANATDTQALSIAVTAPAISITTSSLPGATVGAAYSATLAASGGVGAKTWSISAGSLPAGLTLDGSGAISGTPTAAGTANFTVQAKDTIGTTATKALSITVAPPALNITTSSLPAGIVGTAYSQTLAASGGTGSYTWSVSGGSLPAGLTLNAQGAISGTPTATGTSNFTVQAKDAANTTATRDLSITVNPPTLTVATTALASGTVGTPYAATLAATGGSGGYTWSIAAGTLPLGLSLSGDGTITGAPLLLGTSSFTVQVKDSAGATAVKPLSITVTALPIVITTDSLPPAEEGVAYSQTLAVSGGAGGYRWSLADGALPTGLSLDPSGKISGTPTGGTSTFSVRVTDSAGATASKTYTLTVAGGPSFSGPATLPSGALGASYSATPAVSGGQPPYSFSVASGQLPPGLSLNANTGEISGKPSQAGTFSFTLQARDASGAQTQLAFSLTIAAGLTVTTAPVLPEASLSLAYQATLGAAGGATPYTWAATAGSLPAGVTLHADGTIDGTPTSAGTFTFTATVTDANGAKASRDFTLTVAAGLIITTAPQLPPATPGAAYSAPLTAAGGHAPYTWSVASGGLPAGISLNSGTGVVSGATNALGTFNFQVAVTDNTGLTTQKAFTLVVAPGLTVTSTAPLPDAVAGTPYGFTLEASGGQIPYSWRVSDGALPDGLTLNAASGVISGTPSAAGTFNFTIEVSDAGNLKGSRVFSIVSTLPSLPALSISGVPASVAPAQQPAVNLTIANPFPAAVTGRLTLTFVPAAGLTDDPSIQFSSGGRSVSFTIPANSTSATFPNQTLAVQTGSVAGTLQFTVDALQSGGVALAGPSNPVAAAAVAPAAASIRTVTVNHTSTGFQVVVVGMSNTRELASATVRFHPTSGTTVGTTELTVPVTDAAKTWFGGSGSSAYGGQFTLTLPFTVNGSVSLDSVGVVLTNSVGASTETSGAY